VTRIIQIFTASIALTAVVPLAATAACNDYDFEFEASPPASSTDFMAAKKVVRFSLGRSVETHDQ
jgi:hypothetical protein